MKKKETSKEPLPRSGKKQGGRGRGEKKLPTFACLDQEEKKGEVFSYLSKTTN